jgi:hypothetical protein
MTDSQLTVPIPSDTPPGTYRLTVSRDGLSSSMTAKPPEIKLAAPAPAAAAPAPVPAVVIPASAASGEPTPVAPPVDVSTGTLPDGGTAAARGQSTGTLPDQDAATGGADGSGADTGGTT